MAYNLPPPWDPGYALPKNVRDEGLERHAYVTKQMPRGTYDMPNVGTGGYAVPDYVMQEGYGQGTYTTKWEPRGRYDGPAVPHWLNRRPQVAIERGPGRSQKIAVEAPVIVKRMNAGAVAMHGTDAPLPAVFRNYGTQAADMLIAQVARVAPAQRTATLKAILDRADKTLWKRTQDIARELVAKGATPGQAFRDGLARALSAGIAAEVIRAGTTRTAPKPRSLLGLGCYGCSAALGAVDPSLLDTSGATFQVAPGPQVGDCSADMTKIFAKLPDGTGYWRRRLSTETCRTVTTVVGETRTGGGGGTTVTTTDGTPSGSSTATGPKMLIGPFEFPVGARSGATRAFSVASPEMQAHFANVQAASMKWANVMRAQAKIPPGGSDAFGLLTIVQVDGALVGKPGTKVELPKSVVTSVMPVGKFTEPSTNQKWGVYLKDVDAFGPGSGRLVIRKVEDSWLSSTFGFIKDLVVTIVDVVKDAVKGLADLACDLVNNPGAVQGGAAAGGAPGAAGIAIAQNTACKPGAPPPTEQLPAAGGAGDSILPLALLAGGGVLAIILLTGKKRPSSQTT